MTCTKGLEYSLHINKNDSFINKDKGQQERIDSSKAIMILEVSL